MAVLPDQVPPPAVDQQQSPAAGDAETAGSVTVAGSSPATPPTMGGDMHAAPLTLPYVAPSTAHLSTATHMSAPAGAAPDTLYTDHHDYNGRSSSPLIEEPVHATRTSAKRRGM
jgi:hypothetical protein